MVAVSALRNLHFHGLLSLHNGWIAASSRRGVSHATYSFTLPAAEGYVASGEMVSCIQLYLEFVHVQIVFFVYLRVLWRLKM